MTKKHFLVALMLSPLFLAACGGGSNPPGPEPSADEPLSITCTEGSTTIQYAFKNTTNSSNPIIEYSMNKEKWDKIDVKEAELSKSETIRELKKGETIYFRGENPGGFNEYSSENAYKRFRFTFVNNNEVQLKIGGNIMSLLSKEGYANNKTIPNDYCFEKLFSKFGSAISVPTKGNVDASDLSLPATNLTKYCYNYLFGDNNHGASISKAPKKLPATKAAEYCYNDMFCNAECLTTAPGISLETLANGACYSMFGGCKELNITVDAGVLKFFTCPKDIPDLSTIDMFKGTKSWKEGQTVEAEKAYFYNI